MAVQCFFFSALQAAEYASEQGGFNQIFVKNADASDKTSERKIVIDEFQGTTIAGQVTAEEDDSPLPGVNVLVKGSGRGTVTDLDGSYRINVGENATLVFSYIGYLDKKVEVGNQTVINVRMAADVQQLSEVVVTALGIEREQRSIGYAVSEVPGEELSQASTVNPISALQGKVAGVQIDNTASGAFGSPRIVIRGNSTFNANTQPIFVVDGVVMDNDLSASNGWGNQIKNLNAEDFESVSVLKGAAATALYGSRALNGVVLITTKSGKKRRGIGVSINQTNGVRHIYDEPAFQNEYGYGPTAGMFSNHVTNGRPDRDKHDIKQFAFYEQINGEYIPSLQHNNSEENAASWGPRFEGQDYIDYDGSMAKWVAQPDNYRDMFDLGVLNNSNIAVDGGGENNAFRLSYTYFDEKGVQPKNDFERHAISFKGHQDLMEDRLRVGISVNYALSESGNPPSGTLQTGWFHDGFPRQYDVKKYRDDYKDVDGGVPYPTGTDRYMYTRKSLRWFEIFEQDYLRTENSLLLVGDVQFNITDNLKGVVKGNINQFNFNTESKIAATSQDRLSNARYSLGQGQKLFTSFSAELVYHKQFESGIDFDVLIGTESWNTETASNSASTNRGFKVRDFYNIGNSFDSPNVDAGVDTRKAINSVYAYANLNYKSTLYLSLTGRNDWSSALVYPDGSGDNSYFYPSVSASWVLNESIDLPSFIYFAKLRTSYAMVGNDTDPFRLSTGFVPVAFTQEPTLNMYKFESATGISPDLKPEIKRSFEAGFDLRFIDGRLGVDFSYYKDNTRNQILALNVPNESGISQQIINAGNLQNQGVEVMVNATAIQRNNFSWDIGFNVTQNRDKIIELYPGIEEIFLYGNPQDAGAGTATVAYAGSDYGMLATRLGWKYYQATDESGNPVDDPNNGLPVLSQRNAWSVAYPNGRQNMDSLHIMGNMQPDFYGAVNTALRFKGLSLSVMLDMRFGGEVYSHAYRYGLHQGVIESSLPNRDENQGGIQWVSQGFGQNYFGKTYYDGYIPEGVFPDGTNVSFKDESGATYATYDVGGMTYQEAYDAGYVEPTHWSGYVYRWTSASTGGPLMAIHEVNWINLRDVTLSYEFPQALLGNSFIRSLNLSLTGRDLAFLYNSMPDNINPAIGDNFAGNALQMGFAPYIRSYTFTLRARF
jgi:iron complex outermembrane receptor protein